MRNHLPALVVVITSAAWGQNTVPKSSDEVLDRMHALVERYQRPGAAPDSENAYDIFARAIGAVRESDFATWRAASGSPKDGMTTPSFDAIYYTEDPPSRDAERGAARDALRAYGERGVFTITAQLPALMRAERPRYDSDRSRELRKTSDVGDEVWDGRLLTILLPDLRKSRELARIQMARHQIAVDAGDAKGVGAAFDETLAIARIVSHQGTLIDRLVGIAIVALAMNESLDAIGAGKATAEMLTSYEGAVTRQLPLASAVLAVEVERLSMLDSVRWAYTDGTLSGRAINEIQTMNGAEAKGIPGDASSIATPEQAVTKTNQLFDKLAVYAGQNRQERIASGFLPKKEIDELDTGQMLLKMMVPDMQRAMSAQDQMMAQVAALRVMIALERSRMESGHYPQSLGALPAGSRDAFTDPFCGRPIGYKLIDANATIASKAYILYSTGADAEDNGGVEATDRYAALSSRPEGKGFDYVLFGPSAK